MPSDQRSAWERLGELLTRRRIELDPRYRNRRIFVDERAPGQYKQINTLERGQRSNYEPGTLAAFEQAYDLVPGAIAVYLEAGELETAAASLIERPVRTRVNPSMRRTPELEPYIQVLELERAAGIPPRSPGEQQAWDSDAVSEEEKLVFVATLRLLNDSSRRESERGTGLTPRLAVAGTTTPG